MYVYWHELCNMVYNCNSVHIHESVSNYRAGLFHWCNKKRGVWNEKNLDCVSTSVTLYGNGECPRVK